MKKFFKNILDFVFPIECVGCGDELKRGSDLIQDQTAFWLCDYCFSKIEYNKKQVCPLCGRETETGYSCVCTVGIEGGARIKNYELRIKNGEERREGNLKSKTCPLDELGAGSEPVEWIKNLKSWVDVYVTFVNLKKNPQVAKLIHKLKYEFVEDAAKDLARIGVEFIKRNLKLDPSDERPSHSTGCNGARIRNLLFNGDILFVPIPLHRKRLLWRGFNQSELILREMGERIKNYELGITNEEEEEQKLDPSDERPSHSTGCNGARIRNWKLEIKEDFLIRKKNTLFQGKAKMSEVDRMKNMQGAFEVPPLIPPCKGGKNKGALIESLTPPFPPSFANKRRLIRNSSANVIKDGGWNKARGELNQNEIRGKTIVLFDDVITTGATMEECARVLKEAGASRVIAMAVGKG